MKIVNTLKSMFGLGGNEPPPAGRSRYHRRTREQTSAFVNARYDAAQTHAGNEKWWAASDGLSARSANSPEVRERLRRRSRYEIANNSYAQGIMKTIADDVIGTGPRLQLTGFANSDDAHQVEIKFKAWARAVGLADRMRTMRKARGSDGESFCALIDNPKVDHPVKLDLRLCEADMVSVPWGLITDPDILQDDGLEFDDYGNVIRYWVRKRHPGDHHTLGMLDWDKIDAKHMIHDFVEDRPGQRRGIPEITAALPLFALLRGYTLATLEAAEAIANFAMFLYTEADPDGEGSDDVEPLDEIQINRRMLTTLPRGWKPHQVKPEQPCSTYKEFKREIVSEIARCVCMPYNKAAGDSSDYNFASGKLDHQTYGRSIEVDRDRIERVILEHIFRAWKREAVLIEGYLPQSARSTGTDWSHVWMWDDAAPVDAVKEESAATIAMAGRRLTLARYYGKKGLDWEVEIKQLEEEAKRLKDAGLDRNEITAALAEKLMLACAETQEAA